MQKVQGREAKVLPPPAVAYEQLCYIGIDWPTFVGKILALTETAPSAEELGGA
jgi:hypothetical protein